MRSTRTCKRAVLSNNPGNGETSVRGRDPLYMYDYQTVGVICVLQRTALELVVSTSSEKD